MSVERGSRFILRRYLDGAQLYASGEEPGLGVANLLDEDRSQVWRAPTTDQAHVDVDFGESLPINCVALVNHNLSYEGRIQLSLGDTQGGSDLYDQTHDAWECIWGVDECATDEHGADGYPSDEERQRYWPAGSLRIIYLDQTVIARWLRATLYGPTWPDDYNPDGKIQLGVILAGTYLQADRTPKADLPLGPQDSSRLDYAEGGQHWRDRGPSYRVGRYAYHPVATGQVVGAWWDMLQEAGVGSSFVADIFPAAASQVLRIRNQIYGHLVRLQTITLGRGALGRVQLDIRESY